MAEQAAEASRPVKRARTDERRSYRVRVRGRDFQLSREQVLAEGPRSFLATAFEGEWLEGAAPTALCH